MNDMVGCDAHGVPISRSCISKLPEYKISASPAEVAKTFGVDNITFLASNENPYGCSPKVQQVINDIGKLGHRYPDSSGQNLKSAIAKNNHVDAEQVFLGNGSNEILESVARAYLDAGDEIIVSEHSFAMYPIFAHCAGSNVSCVSMNNWFVDLHAMTCAITQRTKVIYLANANNPTGTMLAQDALVEFLNRVPKRVVVVIDEAYIEFADPEFKSAIELIQRFPNLLVSRTFSKAYGLAGFRIGYGIANKNLVANVEKIQQPFNVNAVAQHAAVAALQDQDFLLETVFENQKYRQIVTDGLRQLGFNVLPSQANFVTFHVPQIAQHCYEFLLSQGVIIRPLTGYQMKDWLRVSIGTQLENELFLGFMREFHKVQHEQ